MLHRIRFHNRTEAGRLLAERFQGRELINPLVLAVPRGGVAVGAALAHDLEADLDVVLARKLRAPHSPELAVGAVAENGTVYVSEYAAEMLNLSTEYLKQEIRFQMDELKRRANLFREVRPQAPVTGRTVIVVDDGIATGATLIAALQATRTQNPFLLIVATPVASADRLPLIKKWCDEVICLQAPEDFRAVGEFYEDFSQLEDEDAVALLRDFSEEIPVSASK